MTFQRRQSAELGDPRRKDQEGRRGGWLSIYRVCSRELVSKDLERVLGATGYKLLSCSHRNNRHE